MGGWLTQTRVDVRRQTDCPKTCGVEVAGEEVARSQATGSGEHHDCELVGLVGRMRVSYDVGKQGGEEVPNGVVGHGLRSCRVLIGMTMFRYLMLD